MPLVAKLWNHDALSLQRLVHRIQDSVHKRAGFLRGKFLRHFDGFVQHNARRRIRSPQFMNRQPQNRAVNRRYTLQPPIFRVLRDNLVERGRLPGGSLEKRVSKASRLVRGFRALPEFAFELREVLLADVPLEEHLHGVLTAFCSQGHVTSAGLSRSLVCSRLLPPLSVSRPAAFAKAAPSRSPPAPLQIPCSRPSAPRGQSLVR